MSFVKGFLTGGLFIVASAFVVLHLFEHEQWRKS